MIPNTVAGRPRDDINSEPTRQCSTQVLCCGTAQIVRRGDNRHLTHRAQEVYLGDRLYKNNNNERNCTSSTTKKDRIQAGGYKHTSVASTPLGTIFAASV